VLLTSMLQRLSDSVDLPWLHSETHMPQRSR
jgi:hypothetical protein